MPDTGRIIGAGLSVDVKRRRVHNAGRATIENAVSNRHGE